MLLLSEEYLKVVRAVSVISATKRVGTLPRKLFNQRQQALANQSSDENQLLFLSQSRKRRRFEALVGCNESDCRSDPRWSSHFVSGELNPGNVFLVDYS